MNDHSIAQGKTRPRNILDWEGVHGDCLGEPRVRDVVLVLFGHLPTAMIQILGGKYSESQVISFVNAMEFVCKSFHIRTY